MPENNRRKNVFLLLVIVITILAFLPSLKNNFVYWDDPAYLIHNPVIKSINPANLKKIFTSFTVSEYQPLTLFSYMLDYQLFTLNPHGYHFTSLVLHLINCALVFWLVFLLSKEILIAGIVAFLFGIHPMHVESVAWISERKDVLYSTFFLGALISYLFYLITQAKRIKYYFIAFILFVLSCLAKPMAVTMPVLLFAFDYLWGRREARKLIIEKIPFLLAALVFGLAVLYSHHQHGTLRQEYLFSLPRSLVIGSYGIVFYLVKLFLPIKLACLYPYPAVPLSKLPLYFFIAPILVFSLAGLVIFSLRYTRKIMFGFLFFIITVMPVLQIIPEANAITADRYTYISYIGLFYILAIFVSWLYSKRSANSPLSKLTFAIISGSWAVVLVVLTWQRCLVWKDSSTLFGDQLQKYPKSQIAYTNRGADYLEQGEYKKAIFDFKQALKIEPANMRAYVNLCKAENLSGNNKRVIILAQEAIKIDAKEPLIYFNLGNAYADMNNYPQAIEAYNQAIQLSPDNAQVYNNLASIYSAQGNNQKAQELLEKAVNIAPDFAAGHYNLAAVYFFRKQYTLAVEHCDKAVSLGYKPDAEFLSELKPYR